jgi:type IV secretory pathway TrbF-like protein
VAAPDDRIAAGLGFSVRALRRANVVALMALIVAGMGIAFAGWQVWKAPPVIPYVVVLDQDTKVINTIRAKPFEANDAVYADIARRWITGIRSRSPVDPLTREVQLEAQRLTDKRLYAQINNLMQQQRDELKNGREGIEIGIEDMVLGPIEHTKEAKSGQTITVVKVTWKERKYRMEGGEGKWAALYAYVGMVEKPQTTTGELEANPLHIYVVSCTFGPAYNEQPGANPRVSEAR